MDIEEMKKYSQNKIEADNLIKQVRQKIKETTWEKQNLREGFTETFKPLISQFEDPGEKSKKQNIFSQNKNMLQNQLALTEGTTNNLLALKGIKNEQERLNKMLEYIENKANFDELPGLEAIEDGEDDQARAPTPTPIISPTPTPPNSPTPTPTPPKSPTPTPQAKEAPIAQFKVEDLNKNLMNKEFQDILKNNGYDYLPSHFINSDVKEISSLIEDVNLRLQEYKKDIHNTALYNNDGFYVLAFPRNQNPQRKTIENIKTHNALSIYLSNLNLLVYYKQQSGSGLLTPQQLLRRFELVNGSLVAGNNGVLPEFIQLAHQLRDLGILTNNQLNKLLRKVIQT